MRTGRFTEEQIIGILSCRSVRPEPRRPSSSRRLGISREKFGPTASERGAVGSYCSFERKSYSLD